MSLHKAVNQAKEVPCSSEITKMIIEEVQGGNTVKAFDKIISLPNETYYILLFAELPKVNYADAETFYQKNGTEYQVITRSDRHGCVEIRFSY